MERHKISRTKDLIVKAQLAKSLVELGLPHGLLEAATWTAGDSGSAGRNLAAAFGLRCYHARDVPKQAMEWCLDLCRENMKPLYERVWSWSDAKKRKQLGAIPSRFVLAYDAPAPAPATAAAVVPPSTSTSCGSLGPLVGFANYRFEAEGGEPVLYCYELQLAACCQRRGLGQRLMGVLEHMALQAGMSKVMLTVFKENTAAVNFYRKLGYSLDASSPDHAACGGVTSAGYHILSKACAAAQQQQAAATSPEPAAAAATPDAPPPANGSSGGGAAGAGAALPGAAGGGP